jgi:hypothetical protein
MNPWPGRVRRTWKVWHLMVPRDEIASMDSPQIGRIRE